MADLTGSFIPTEHYAELNIPQPIRNIQSRRDLSEESQNRYDRFKDMKTEPRFRGFGDVVTEEGASENILHDANTQQDHSGPRVGGDEQSDGEDLEA